VQQQSAYDRSKTRIMLLAFEHMIDKVSLLCSLVNTTLQIILLNERSKVKYCRMLAAVFLRLELRLKFAHSKCDARPHCRREMDGLDVAALYGCWLVRFD